MRNKMIVAVLADGRVVGASKRRGEPAQAMEAATATRAARRLVVLWRSTS
jgi:hypothetical protein